MAITNQGKWLELTIKQAALEYQRQGRLSLEKVDPPMRVMGTGPHRRTVMLPNPFLDFVGTWTEQCGRAIFIEAKSTADPRLPIVDEGVKTAGLKFKQIQALKRWRAAGAAVGVLWGYQEQLRFIPMQAIESQQRNGIKHLKWDNATPIPRGYGWVVFDWIRPLADYNPLPQFEPDCVSGDFPLKQTA